jgi:8-amino-7-oxononanoate synthase
MDHKSSLDKYAWRRARAAGGPMISGGTFEDNIAALKEIYLQPLDKLQADIEKRGGTFVSFANYDYLGLGQDLRIRQAAAHAALTQGVGALASRLVGGSRTIHDVLEREIADFVGVEDAMTVVSGYMTNASLLGHLLTRSDLIVVDDLCHNSIMVGAHASPATVMRFEHGNMEALEAILATHREDAKRALIVVEGLYSMDGDVPDLPRLLQIRDRFGAWLMVDEAHSIGVLGATGRGVAEHFGVDANEIDFIIGTLSKSFAGSGGFVAGRKTVIEWLRFTLPAFVFSVGLSPVVAAAVQEGFAILRKEPWRPAKVQENSRFFVEEARARGLQTGPAIGAGVVPIQFPTHAQCLAAASRLIEEGYYVPPIPMLAVSKDKPRIRFFLSATHTREQIVGALNVITGAVQHPGDYQVTLDQMTTASEGRIPVQ